MFSFINKAVTYGGAMRRYNTCKVRRYNSGKGYPESAEVIRQIKERKRPFKKTMNKAKRFERGDFEEGSTPVSQVASLRDRLQAVEVKTCVKAERMEERLDLLLRRQRIQEIDEITNRFEEGHFEEGWKPLSQVLFLRDRFRVLTVKTGSVYDLDKRLDKRLETLVREGESREEYNATQSLYSKANMYLHSGAEFDFRQVQMIHGLGIKSGIANNNWARSRIRSLYYYEQRRYHAMLDDRKVWNETDPEAFRLAFYPFLRAVGFDLDRFARNKTENKTEEKTENKTEEKTKNKTEERTVTDMLRRYRDWLVENKKIK